MNTLLQAGMRTRPGQHYYSSMYGIDVMNVTRVDAGLMSCEACSVCPQTYHFGLTVNASEMQPLIDEGWTRGGKFFLFVFAVYRIMLALFPNLQEQNENPA